ncbi:PREDICTED: prohormone-2-like [Ceratosolen solmsi marchali]|uniref:Prohormone-2-like n=1 Tax=Ceratosolen solmsi marchali TaxID=326594 RepID=A0AAJ6YG69_9HYME|nr:PREDICTED: prohormone-2-like [Ceratosolen solmsi marchali]
MLSDCFWFLLLGIIFVTVQSLPTGIGEDAKKKDPILRPKVKRTQELLMFGNQQRQATENNDANNFSPSAEKRTLSNSGLDDESSSLTESEQQSPSHLKALPNSYVMDQSTIPLHDKSYDVSSYYQEPRYKRESEIDPEEYLALLSFYDNERRNRGNWLNYGNEEYENVDDANIIGVDDEDPRSSSWLDSPLGYPQQHRYLTNDPLLGSDLAALGRNRPNNYYEQYLGQQYGGTGGQQYDAGVQYGTPQYGIPYVQQHAYYSPEKRFMMNRKRSQNYDSYGDRSGIMLNTRGYLNYKNRLLY